MATDPWADFRAPQSAAPAQAPASLVPIPGTGERQPPPQTDVNTERDRVALEAARRALEAGPTPTGFRRSADGNLEFIPGGPADPSRTTPRTRQLPQAAIAKLSDGVTALDALERSTGHFNPDYAGNIAGGVENWLQSYNSDIGTPGQNQFWADVYATDNIARNALFGASLTEGERAAWERTTVNPRMDAREVRANLERRREIARTALRRLARTYRANHFDEDAIRESLGERQGVLDDTTATAPVQSGATSEEPATAPPGTHVAFSDEASPETPPGGEEFSNDLQARMQRGEFRRPEQIVEYGRQHGFNIPQDQAEAAIRALRQGQPVVVNPPRYEAPAISDARGGPPSAGVSLGLFGRPILDVNSEQVDAAARGAADVLSLGLSDEIAAAGDTLFNGGTYSGNLYRQRGIDAYDEQNNFVPRVSGQIAGGAALPSGGASTARELARVGAGYGGAYGIGSGDGIGDRLVQGAEGGVLGGATAATLGLLSSRLARGGGNRNNGSRAAELAQMAERQGVQVTSPDLNPGQRSTYSFLESLPGSGGRVRADLQRGAQQMETRVAEIGAGVERGAEAVPGAVPRQTAGQTILDASRGYIDRSRDVVGRLYDRAAQIAGDTQIAPANAVRALDEHLAQLSETPSASSSKISVLNQLRADLVDEAGNPRPLSIGAFRDLRSAMREELGARGLRFTDTERRVMQVIDAAGQDIEAGLSGSALRAYRRADQSHRERAQLVDNVYQRFVGANRNNSNSPEQAMAALENMAAPRAGDAESLTQMASRLRPEERQQLASHIASTLGRAGTEGEAAFSPATFFRQVQRYSDEARIAIWGRRGARDLAELAALAEARKGTLERLNNSGSGRVSNWFRGITTILSGGGAGAGLGAMTGLGAGAGSGLGLTVVPAVLGGAYLRARALGNPRIVSILAAAARAETPQAQRGVLRSLAELSARQPALQPDILPIQRILEGGARSAAAEDADNPR
jgi:hypothetical protein